MLRPQNGSIFYSIPSLYLKNKDDLVCRVPEDKLAKVMPEIEEEDAEDRGLSVTSLMLGAKRCFDVFTQCPT